jgi:hypothetical protein
MTYIYDSERMKCKDRTHVIVSNFLDALEQQSKTVLENTLY